MTTLKNFINGKFVDHASNETMSFENPAIGQVYGTAPLSREADVDAACTHIVEAVKRLRAMSPLWEMVQEGIDLKNIQWAAH